MTSSLVIIIIIVFTPAYDNRRNLQLDERKCHEIVTVHSLSRSNISICMCCYCKIVRATSSCRFGRVRYARTNFRVKTSTVPQRGVKSVFFFGIVFVFVCLFYRKVSNQRVVYLNGSKK